MTQGVLHGKTCVVIGAGRGIGRAIALAFSAEGAHTIAADLRHDAKDAGTSILQEVIDATDGGALVELAARHAGADVLVNCVGIVPHGTILQTPAAALEDAFRVNVLTMHHAIAAFLPAMRARRSGSIVNIASVVSSLKAATDRYAYATTKAAVIGLTKAVARDFIGDGIRCNAICPGTVISPSLQERMAATGDSQKALAAFTARQPMGRLGHAEEIAAVAVLLAADSAAFMTGQTITIDGGMSL